MEKQKNEKKKKGIFSAIWESMTKTGGCCGSGESCCGPIDEKDEKKNKKNKQTK